MPSYHTERYVAELRHQKCEVLLASFGNAALVDRLLTKRGPHRLFHFLLAGREIRDIVNEWRPDVVNPHYAAGYGFSAAQANIQYRVPVVLNLWGGDVLLAPRKSWLHRIKSVKALQCADCVCGDSQYIIDESSKLTKLKNTRIIPWGIESRYVEFHKSNYKFSQPVRVIVPRRQESLYNNLFLFESLLPLVREKRISLTFAKLGADSEKFQRKVRRLAGDAVAFYDPMPREEYLLFLAGHDIYLSAARVDSSPVTLIEAMALGLVPVVGNIPGVREWVTPENGFADMRSHNLERVKAAALFEKNIAEQMDVMELMVNLRRR
jgi:glycosyltransferase involved in cell wall biosynthesis